MRGRVPWVEAELEVGGTRIRYRRAGTGAPALLLGVDPGAGDPAFEELARSFRVYLLLGGPPLRRGEAEAWLHGVIEGLGLFEPELYADPALAPVLSRLVTRNRGLVGRVTFLAPGAGG